MQDTADRSLVTLFSNSIRAYLLAPNPLEEKRT